MAIPGIIQQLGDKFFKNKRLKELESFASKGGFAFRNRMAVHQFPQDIKSMGWWNSSTGKEVRGYLFKELIAEQLYVHIIDVPGKGNRNTTVFIYECRRFDFPSFKVEPRSSLSRMGHVFSSGDWSKVHSGFDKRFIVSSENINRMRIILIEQFGDTMMELEDFSVEGRGIYLALYRHRRRTEIDAFLSVFNKGLKLVDIVLY
ncbi:MAG TPA: hypothetical protein PKC30_06960 [Saprospiraceae bacterium]|nr:hypothetical protein [Saprospiraceae bacterium]